MHNLFGRDVGSVNAEQAANGYAQRKADTLLHGFAETEFRPARNKAGSIDDGYAKDEKVQEAGRHNLGGAKSRQLRARRGHGAVEPCTAADEYRADAEINCVVTPLMQRRRTRL